MRWPSPALPCTHLPEPSRPRWAKAAVMPLTVSSSTGRPSSRNRPVIPLIYGAIITSETGFVRANRVRVGRPSRRRAIPGGIDPVPRHTGIRSALPRIASRSHLPYQVRPGPIGAVVQPEARPSPEANRILRWDVQVGPRGPMGRKVGMPGHPSAEIWRTSASGKTLSPQDSRFERGGLVVARVRGRSRRSARGLRAMV